MGTYRIINRELSLNNQELRNVINKLKHEVTYLNLQLLEQRKEFYRLKTSIVKTIEQKYIETIALIIPDKSSDQKQQGKLDIASHRRSCSNATAADPIKNRSHSRPAGSSSCASDVMDISAFKLPIPRIVVEGSGRLSKSPGKCPQSIANQSQSRKSEDLQISKNRTEDLNSSELGQTLKTSNTSLITTNKEQSCGPDAANTLSDATINCLLETPCSTPYNQDKVRNETTFQQKQLRVLVKKMSEEKLSQLSTQNNHCSRLSPSRLKNKLFTSKSAQIEACHPEMKCSQLSAPHFTTMHNSTFKYNINSSSDGESFVAGPKTMPNKIQTIIPDKSSDQKQQGKLDIASHRRSCSNVTAADPIKNRSHSPPAGSSSCASDVLDESTFKLPIPRIVVEGSGRLSKSPGKCPQSIANQSQSRKSEDLQISKSRTEDLNSSESSELGQTLKTSNTSLITINEEKSCGPDAANETLSDATINCLLDAPCSTPYNQDKVRNETTFQQKRLRVLVKRMSEEKLSQLSNQNSHCSGLSASRLKNTLFSKMKCSQLSASHFTTMKNSTCEYNINSSSDGESFAAGPKTMPNKIQTKEKIIRLKDKSIKKPTKKERPKGKLNLENCGTYSDFAVKFSDMIRMYNDV